MAVHYPVRASVSILAALRHGHRLCPRFVLAGEPGIPFLVLYRRSKDSLDPIGSKPVQNFLCRCFGVQAVALVATVDGFLNGFLAGNIEPFLLHGLGSFHLFCPVFKARPDFLHVAGFHLLILMVEIIQRRGRGQ